MKLRCGVAGLGRGRTFVQELNGVEGCEVVAVCDTEPSKLADFTDLNVFTDYEVFIKEAGLDIVAVITPGPCHAEQSVKAMEAGIHVMSETPCVYTLEEAQNVVETAQKTGMKYMLTEDYIYLGWVQKVKELVDQGQLGTILYAEGEYTHDCRNIMFLDEQGQYVPYAKRHEHQNLRKAWRATDLPPIKYCSHTLGPLLYLMGDRCVTATGLSTGCLAAQDIGAPNMQAGLFKTAKGAVVRLTNGFSVAHPFAYFAGLYGSEGSVKLLNIGGLSVKAWVDGDPAFSSGWTDLPLEWGTRADGRKWLSVMVEEFVDSVRSDTRPPVDVYESMDYTLPGICAHISGEQGGRCLEVPDFRPAP